MDISVLNSSQIDDYDLLVDNSIEGSLFHKSWWLDAIRNNSKVSCEIKYYGLFEHEKLMGAIPIPIFKKFGVKFIHNPKLTPYLGSIFLDDNSKLTKKSLEISRKKEANIKFAEELKRHGFCLYYSFGNNHVDLQPYKWQGFNIAAHYTYYLNLNDLDRIWADIDRKRRHDITRNANSISIRFGEIEEYINLYSETMNRQNHMSLNAKIWKAIHDICKERNQCEIFTAYLDNEAIASLFLVWDSNRSYYLGGGIKENSRGAMSRLIWEGIKYSKEKIGLKEFDFEGSDVMNIEFFFRKFGGDIRPIFFISEDSILCYSTIKAYKLFKKRLNL
jgi:hypothetical protein